MFYEFFLTQFFTNYF